MAEQVVKLKKKQWYPIVAPKEFGNAILGETLVYEPSTMIGKTLTQSLMNLISDTKKQNVNIHFKVVEVDGNKAKAAIIGYEIISSSVKRFVRRNSEKADLSFNCETADNVYIRVKPVFVTKSSVKGSVATKLRNILINFLVKTIKKMTYEELINNLISYKLQHAMRSTLNKIYPLKVCEIRYLGIETRTAPKGLEAEVKEQK